MCGATPKLMNNLEEIKKRPISAKGLQYGMSTLHAWIRSMECCLHIAYKMKVQKWQAKTTEGKSAVQDAKKKIQETFQNKLGLIVDVPKSSGYGTSNDGNTARRFFKNAKEVSEILKINEKFIHNLHVILCTLSSGITINAKKL